MMNNYIAINNMTEVLQQKLLPSITLWNRLEARPRTDDFDRALKAEVRDPLWMLTKQWQLGEFRGDDAGSPAFAKIQMATTRLTKYQADSKQVQTYDEDVPLEAKVEQKKIPFKSGAQDMSLDIRLMMGRHWLKLIKTDFPAGLRDEYILLYKILLPDPDDKNFASIVAHREAWQQVAAVAGRSMDGYVFYAHLKKGNSASEGTSQLGDVDLDALGEKFIKWFENFFLQPIDDDNNAWLPSRMEYQFAVSAPDEGGEKVMVADEYYHGHLDWYNLDIDPLATALETEPDVVLPPDPQNRKTNSFFPVNISFDGMPHTRWWRFEDSNTNFGDINPDTTDLNKLLFIEFGLIYANDWFLVPFTLPAGSIANVKGLSVTNVFGEKTWVEPAGKGLDDAWKRWNMYALNTKGNQREPADNSLLILPTVEKILEGKPLEEVLFIRDEVANMVWAIEKKIPLPTGSGKHGGEAAFELHKFYQKILNKEIGDGIVIPDDIEFKANIRYQIMNTVPENWIPFIPVHVDGSSREVQLQRASMPRILENDAPGNAQKIKPRTQLVREGLEKDPVEAYFIHEEEIPRAGIRAYQTFQRTRWYDGKVVNWFGARKQTGRGEGHSGLAFDQIIPTAKRRV
ncbi:hypothetical protein M8845_15200 [Gelidibacter japonicus]|uniref:hypothetical protein n=1 Tax=Gelidibacter japonicus TaxID=1962232 RepID=UPI00202184C3|nr:hypothetical protein [Gelidibacter japonicus]MCL8008775.1 hypothetical protein [Gelidibacter japonicus]